MSTIRRSGVEIPTDAPRVFLTSPEQDGITLRDSNTSQMFICGEALASQMLFQLVGDRCQEAQQRTNSEEIT